MLCLPVVIDSPLQQDQDDSNAVKILEFIASEPLEDVQIFLGTVSTHDVEFQGLTIELSEQYQLLNIDSYNAVIGELETFGRTAT